MECFICRKCNRHGYYTIFCFVLFCVNNNLIKSSTMYYFFFNCILSAFSLVLENSICSVVENAHDVIRYIVLLTIQSHTYFFREFSKWRAVKGRAWPLIQLPCSLTEYAPVYDIRYKRLPLACSHSLTNLLHCCIQYTTLVSLH